MSDTIVYKYDHRLRRPVAIKNIKEEPDCDRLPRDSVCDNNVTKDNVITKKEDLVCDRLPRNSIIDRLFRNSISDDVVAKQNIIKRLAFFCFYGQILVCLNYIQNEVFQYYKSEWIL